LNQTTPVPTASDPTPLGINDGVASAPPVVPPACDSGKSLSDLAGLSIDAWLAAHAELTAYEVTDYESEGGQRPLLDAWSDAESDAILAIRLANGLKPLTRTPCSIDHQGVRYMALGRDQAIEVSTSHLRSQLPGTNLVIVPNPPVA
jgi:hypothetical protein